jgi:hypothetical protein
MKHAEEAALITPALAARARKFPGQAAMSRGRAMHMFATWAEGTHAERRPEDRR